MSFLAKKRELGSKADKRGTIDLKYPILLVHGAGFEDELDDHESSSWGSIPEYFKSKDILVLVGHTKAWASIEENAEIINDSIKRYREEYGFDKINIIAHSKGGLEARYFISCLDKEDVAVSLTTISTPHHGIEAVDKLSKTKLYVAVVKLLAGKYFGSYEDFIEMSLSIKKTRCEAFNKRTPDKKGVYYQSYGSAMKGVLCDPLLAVPNFIIRLFDGKNDGLVPVDSSKWGNYKGEFVNSNAKFGFSHRYLVDLQIEDKVEKDVYRNYSNILKDLSCLGF